jgi:hypothetical protein
MTPMTDCEAGRGMFLMGRALPVLLAGGLGVSRSRKSAGMTYSNDKVSWVDVLNSPSVRTYFPWAGESYCGGGRVGWVEGGVGWTGAGC